MAHDTLNLDISDLRNMPAFWDAFIEIVESSIITEEAHLFGGSIDGLLALCANNLYPHGEDNMELQSSEAVNEQQDRSHDDIETDLYFRLVRLFRRRGPRVCSDLLEDVLVAFRDAEHEHAKLIVESEAFLHQILANLPGSPSVGVSSGAIFRTILVEEFVWTFAASEWNNLARLLNTPWEQLVTKDRPFFKARSEAMIGWMKNSLRREKRMQRAAKDEEQGEALELESGVISPFILYEPGTFSDGE